MPSVIIRESQRGLLYKNGKLVRWLEPGQHSWWSFFAETDVVTLELDNGLIEWSPELMRILPKGAGEELIVAAQEIAIVSIDKNPVRCLLPGRYILWQLRHKVTAEVFDCQPVLTEIPQRYWSLVPAHILQQHVVLPHQKRLLYVNGKLDQILEAGRYGVQFKDRQIQHSTVDLREQELQIVGQEVMTNDKVSLRINLLVKYKITDVLLSEQSVESLHDALYSETQMIARRFVSGNTVDQLLESRQQAADTMKNELAPRALEWGVEIQKTDLKDIVLPGEMKTLLNKVIEAEKAAQANIILRREETAATRSLANTAKMLEKNPMLLRLKELEHIKELAGNINQLNVISSGQDLLGKLLLTPIRHDDD